MNNQDLHIWSYYHKTLKLAIKFIGCVETAKDITSDALINVIIMCRSEAPPDIMHDPFPYICTSLRNLVHNIKTYLKKDGFVILTLFDPDRIIPMFDDNGKINNLTSRPLPYTLLSGILTAYSTNSNILGINTYFITELKIESSTRHSYHKAIKTTLNYAKGLPNSFQLPKDDIYFNHKVQYKPKIKVSLKSIEIHKMFDSTNYGFLTEKEAFAIHLFLFSFSTMGMRFKDVLLLKWGNIKSGDLTYVMSKNERDMRVKLNGNIVNILKYFLPSELYINPFIKNKIEEPKFKNSLSIQIYKLESEFYFLKTQQMTLDTISSITSKKIKHSESPKVKKIIEKRDSLLIELIQQYAKTNDSYIFTNKFDDDLNYQQIYNRAGSLNAIINLDLKSVSKLFGIREFSFHSARHTFAYLSRQNKTDIYLISKCLGHSSLSITEQYLRTFEDQEVYDANDSMVTFINQFYK